MADFHGGECAIALNSRKAGVVLALEVRHVVTYTPNIALLAVADR